MDRMNIITHQGKRVLVTDYSYCAPEQVIELLDEVERVVCAEPNGALMTLSDFTGATITKEAADRMKVVAAKDKPHVRRAAFVGAESLPDVYYRALTSFSGRRFPNFASRDEALAWLVKSEEEAAAS
jgi:hypothetical protein